MLRFVSFIFIIFFFFKQKTAYEMRISDWSSDVCSSDLPAARSPRRARTCRPVPGAGHGERSAWLRLRWPMLRWFAPRAAPSTPVKAPAPHPESWPGPFYRGYLGDASYGGHPGALLLRWDTAESEVRRAGRACVGTCEDRGD